MERRVLVEEYQKVTQADFLNMGLYPEKTFDDIGSGLLIPDAAFWGFPCVAQGTNVLVGPGWLISAGVVYYNDDEGGTTLDLLPRLPTTTRRYIAVTAWGQEVDASTQPRTFLTDVETRETEARVVPTERRRRAELSLVSGIEAPDPTYPALASNVTPVAWVLCDTGGIVSIVPAEDYRAPNLRTLDTFARAMQLWKDQIAALIDTLATDLAALAGRIAGLAQTSLVVAVAEQLAQVKNTLDLPASYSLWGADHFLTDESTDTLDADNYSFVDEGLHFPREEERDSQIGLLNPIDQSVMVQGNMMLPAYDLVSRISSVGNDGELAISNISFSEVHCVKLSRTRERMRYGTPFKVSTSTCWWKMGDYDPVTHIFSRGGETFVVNWCSDDGHDFDDDDHGNDDKKHKKKKDKHDKCHKMVRLTQLWHDTWSEYYWDDIVTTETINGSTLGETFLNSQEGWLCGIDLYFTRKSATGNVRVMICETNAGGSPNYRAVIGDATLAPADMHIYPTSTRVLFQPIALKAGVRYAVLMITGGAHYLATTNGNKYSSGTLFTCTDGEWFQGDLLTDIAFQLVFARFRAPRVEVTMQPLSLSGGIAAIDMNIDVASPQAEGFEISHQIQLAGGEWVSLNDGTPDLLLGLPDMVPYRVVFLGTTEMMPGLGVGSNSRVTTWRPANHYKHVSEVRTMPVGVLARTVTVTMRLEAWRGDILSGGHQACTIKLKYGSGNYNSLKTADSVVNYVPPDDENALVKKAVFTFASGSGQDDYKVQVEGTTDNVLTTYHISERIDVALST